MTCCCELPQEYASALQMRAHASPKHQDVLTSQPLLLLRLAVLTMAPRCNEKYCIFTASTLATLCHSRGKENLTKQSRMMNDEGCVYHARDKSAMGPAFFPSILEANKVSATQTISQITLAPLHLTLGTGPPQNSSESFDIASSHQKIQKSSCATGRDRKSVV